MWTSSVNNNIDLVNLMHFASNSRSMLSLWTSFGNINTDVLIYNGKHLLCRQPFRVHALSYRYPSLESCTCPYLVFILLLLLLLADAAARCCCSCSCLASLQPARSRWVVATLRKCIKLIQRWAKRVPRKVRMTGTRFQSNSHLLSSDSW